MTQPSDVAAEKIVLGGLMLGAEVDGLAASHFYRPAHSMIYEAITRLRAAGSPAEPVAVADELRRAGQLSRIGGGPYLHGCIEAVPTRSNAAHYARIVREHAERRDVLEHASRMTQAALNPGEDLANVRALAVMPIGTKQEERSKSSRPGIPAADPVMYAGLLGEITAAAAPTTEADPVGIFASLLAGVGAFIGPGPYVRVGNTRHPLLIWPLLLGRTGSGRKGEATGTAELFLRRAAPDSADRRTVSGLSSGEGLIERIRDSDDPESIDKRLLVVETEFTSVLARSKREGSTLAAVQRQAWEGRALSVLNRKQLKASASHIAIIGHITPQEFRLRLAEADMTGGTYNRYLPLFVERSRRLPIPRGVDEPAIQDLSTDLAKAIDAARGVGALQLGAGASRVWTGELYDELTEGDDDDQAEAEFTRRAAPYCLRLAGLLAALEGRSLIGADDLAAAAAMVRYSIATARYVLDRQARNPRLDRIRREIDAAGPDGLSRTQVSALFSRNLTKEVLETLLVELTSDGAYEVSRTATKGRPAETYRRTDLSS